MHTYKYEITASTDIRGTYTKLTGSVSSKYQMTYKDVRTEAIKNSPKGYISFGVLKILEEVHE